MTDHLTKFERSRNMSKIRSRDTAPELAVRTALRSMKIRYRSGGELLPGKPDIQVYGRKLLIFVHGCFWHQHKRCKRANTPKTNKGYWLPKLRRNFERDKEVKSQLQKDGWRVKVVWECQAKNSDRLRGLIKNILN